MTEDVRRLLGGYATGTLTGEERQLLYTEALNDSSLFEALADEQALRDLLDDSASRAQVLMAVENRRFSILNALRDWFEHPKSKALTAAAAVLLVAVAVSMLREQPIEIARNVTVPSAEMRPAETIAMLPEREPEPKKQVAPRLKKQVSPQIAPPTALASPAASPFVESAKPASPTVMNDVRYTLLLRGPGGDYAPVAPDFGFSEGDRARLRFETNVRGMLLVTGPGNQTLYAGTVAPDLPVLVPGDLTFQSGSQDVAAEFTPLTGTGATLGFSRAPSSGVVGGIIGGVPGDTLGQTGAARLRTSDAESGSASVRLKITLRKK
ncbi:MAG: hypothetical protein H7Y20_15325 [Bryobacteraceae bacterium]|nr:hypothetical protein [Bryobacteraceae bacterium]